MWRCARVSVLFLGALVCGACAERRPAITMISAAQVSGRELWVATDDGALMSLDLDTGARPSLVSENVVSIAKSHQRIWLLRTVPSGRVSIARVVDGVPRDVAQYARDADDVPITLLVRDESVAVLSTASVRLFAGGRWSVRRLTTPIRSLGHVVVGAPRTGDSLYLGFDHGEWGGGVVRVNTATGAVSGLAQAGERSYCDWPLAAACGPTTAIIADPQHSDCVIAAQGLVHFSPSGEILRVCGDTVTQLYEREYQTANRNPYSAGTVPFFALMPTPRGFLAAGGDELYRFEDRAPTVRDLPRLRRRGQIWLAEDRANRVVLVGTEVRRRYSVSRFSILFAPMD